MNTTRRWVVKVGPALTTLTAFAGLRSAWALSAAELTPAAMEATAPPLPAVGSRVRVPDVALLDGKPFVPSAHSGRATLVYWWASTCPFCALQSPEMQKLWMTHQASGLTLLALSVDKKPGDAQAYLRKKGYTFPSAWVSPEFHRMLPKPRGLPITLVLGADGSVLQAERGQMFSEDVAQLARWV